MNGKTLVRELFRNERSDSGLNQDFRSRQVGRCWIPNIFSKWSY